MPVTLKLAQKIVSGTAALPMTSFFAVSGAVDPAYLVVTAFDRAAYAAGASGAVGAFGGSGATLGLTPTIGNARAAGIVFTWMGGQYVNAVYGAYAALQYTPSSSAGDVTVLSVFTTSNLALATRDAQNALALAQADASGNAGSTTIVSDADPVAASASASTPEGIAAVAQMFVGRAWNDQGCWNLAATIAAEAGAGLPVTATALGVQGHASGEWVVVYDGPAHAGAGWRNLVTAGDVVTFGTPGGGGHITTCVAGSGATATLIDNVVYQNAQGQIVNAAGDGSQADVLVAAAHPALQEWAGVAANSVVIYALDTPVISALTATSGAQTPTPLSAFAAVSDPAGRTITRIQVYDPRQGVTLLVGGAGVHASSAATALSVASLSAVGVEGLGPDTLEVRASNGLYWGDWQSIPVGAAPAAAAEFAAAPRLQGDDALHIAWHR